MRAISKDKQIRFYSKELMSGNFKVLKVEFVNKKMNIHTRINYYGFKTREQADGFILRKTEGQGFEINKDFARLLTK